MKTNEYGDRNTQQNPRQARLNAALSVVWNDLNDGERLCLFSLFEIADKGTLDPRILEGWQPNFLEMECSMRVMRLLMDIYDATWGEGDSTDCALDFGTPFGVVVSYAAYQIATGDKDKADRPDYAA